MSVTLCEYVYLYCRYWDNVVASCMALRIHLYAIFFTAVSCTLHIACLHALQKLVGKSTVSLRMSIAKHVKSSFEKAAQVVFCLRLVFHRKIC